MERGIATSNPEDPSYGSGTQPHPTFPLTQKLVGHSPNYALAPIGKGERESGLDPTYVWTAPSKLTNAKLGKVQCSRTLSFSSRDFEGPRLCSSGPIQLSDQLTHHKTA